MGGDYMPDDVVAWGTADGMIAAFLCMIVFYSMRKTLLQLLAPTAGANKMKET
eukprot:SAG11_NODE_257_length_11556_cov_8.547176_5_plen_53_part_00